MILYDNFFKHIVETNKAINLYVDVFDELDNYYGLDNIEVDMFEEERDGAELSTDVNLRDEPEEDELDRLNRFR